MNPEQYFLQLREPSALVAFDQLFVGYLQEGHAKLHANLLAFRADNADWDRQQLADFLVGLAAAIESFIAKQFGLEQPLAELRHLIISHDPIMRFKQHYVARLAKRALNKIDIKFSEVYDRLSKMVELNGAEGESQLANYALALLDQEDANAEAIDTVVAWCVSALKTAEGQAFTKNWQSFKSVEKLDFAQLVKTTKLDDDKFARQVTPNEAYRARDGFDLTDDGMPIADAFHEADYCVYCHKNDGDYCSTGFPQKRNNPELGFKINPLDELLHGCPLDEKISEMNWLYRQGYALAALAVITRDNPTCALTGHRICNDCMKACIYQKQTPVDIPQVETRVLKDILYLPWGAEIYDLLMRWNPLRQQHYIAKPYNGKKVLVMGLGPAGLTMAHYLSNEGMAVVGVDGLKIEPLAKELLANPIKNFDDIIEPLSERRIYGFGGVAEYGITVRWDKNFLKLMYILLARRSLMQVFGGVRFGGTLTVEKAWSLGFDHLVLAVGAGLPKELPIPNSLAPGMRQANDFLMALQLTGAAKANSIANLQVRLPAVVIGGGLTGVDTATEVQAYYLQQIQKVYRQYQTLIAKQDEATVRAGFTEQELVVLDEFCAHAKELQAGKMRPIDLLRKWGGVTIAYRKSMQQSPAYRKNPEELAKAMQEGIYYLGGVQPAKVLLDKYGACQALEFIERVLDEGGTWVDTGKPITLAARSIFVATGAKPNVAYEFEHRGTFDWVGFEYQSYRYQEGQLIAADNQAHCKEANFGAVTSYQDGQRLVSYIGDTHPVFHGSVVKAVASAKKAFPKILNALTGSADSSDVDHFQDKINHAFTAKVVAKNSIKPGITEIIIQAPLAAAQYQPGQFYKLQNFAAHAEKSAHHQLATEGVALLAYPIDNNPEQLGFVVFDQGVSSKLLQQLPVGEPVLLMGPTGNQISHQEHPKRVTLVGSEMAEISIRAMANWATVNDVLIDFVTDTKPDNLLWPTYTQQITNSITYCQDKAAILAHLAENATDLVWVIAKPCLLQAVQALKLPKAVGAVYGPMQCMLKGVCAACLQWQLNPDGTRKKAVYACSWQHQPLELVDIGHLAQRLSLNSLQEKLSQRSLQYDSNH